MSWANAKMIAREYSQLMLARIRDQERTTGQPASRVRLTDYEDEACYRFLKGTDAWPLEFHRMVNSAVARELKRAGYDSEIVKIQLAEYWCWLDGKQIKDSTEHRALFILGSD